MIINIKKLILEGSPLLQNIQLMLQQGVEQQVQYGKKVQQDTKREIDSFSDSEGNALEESLILAKRQHLSGSINPNEITKGKAFRNIDDVTQSGSSHAAGLSGKDEMGETMSRAKDGIKSITESTLTGTDTRGLNKKNISDNRKSYRNNSVLTKKSDTGETHYQKTIKSGNTVHENGPGLNSLKKAAGITRAPGKTNTFEKVKEETFKRNN